MGDMVWSSICWELGQAFEAAAPAVRMVTGAFENDAEVTERLLFYLAEGPRGASLATLRRRAAYGGRKGVQRGAYAPLGWRALRCPCPTWARSTMWSAKPCRSSGRVCAG